MIAVKLNGRAFPSSLLGNILYRPDVFVDNREVFPSKWSVTTSSGTIASGDNATIQFTPTEALPHTLHVRAVNLEGYQEEEVVVFNSVLPGTGGVELGVKWSKSVYTVGDTLHGVVYAATPEGQPVRSLSWVLYRNNVRVSSGTSGLVSYPAVDGVYRVSVSAYDTNGVLYVADSAIAVAQNYEIQSAIAPTVPDASCVLLGAVYTDTVKGSAGNVTSLPYQLASYTQELWLLPGTTHIQFDLDPLQNTVDDEVVVRTLTGNWALLGYPNGLYNESVGYDYRLAELIPAPADLKMRFTVDAFNVHGASYAAFNFRVRVKCYRNVSTIWRYEQCAYAIHPGGQGKRSRKWALLFSEVDVEVDVGSDFNRYRSGRSVVPYTTPIVTSLPGMALSSSGSPIPVDATTGIGYTEANRYAIYECAGYPELDAKAVAAAEDMRPFAMTLEMPNAPPLIQRIKRLGSTMGIYLSNGAVAEGAIVTVRIKTSTTEVVHAYTMPASVYANTTEDYVLAGTVDISDISDFQFDFNGIVASFYADEDFVVESGTLPQTIPAWGPAHIYTGTEYPLVNFDGACYINPTRVPTYDSDDIAVVMPLSGDCTNSFCGPVGVYCYTTQCGSVESAYFLQSYLYPSPYVALPANPYKCYSSPVLAAEGTVYVDPVRGIISLRKQQSISYPDAGLCGDAYIYSPCLGGSDILVVYPCATSTHSFVENNGACYAFSSALPAGNQIPGLNFTAFDNWTVDGRVDLIGSCPVISLYDLVPGHGMYVDMVGSPGTGTLTSNDTWNLVAGTYRVSIDIAGNHRTTGTFSIGVLVGTHGTVFYETGSLMPFTQFDHTVVLTSPETVQLKIYQSDVTPWGGVLNAGNLVDNIVFYAVGGGTLLADHFAYFQPQAYATVLSVGSVTAVADCTDILCTGSFTTGDSYVYQDMETGSVAGVRFERLDLGVPHFAVSSETISQGTSGLSSGRVTVRFDKPRKFVMSVSGTGSLRFALGLVGVPKKLILLRGGMETIYAMSVNQPSTVLNVLPGDAIYVDVGTPFGGISKRITGRFVDIAWVPKVALPKLYATATLMQSGSIRALGFCGLSNRQEYHVFDALPLDNSTADVVNPDSVVTAQGASSAELVLLRNRTSGDVLPTLPEGLGWYAGEMLAQPITFKYYAAREAYGAHGEMDVWVQTEGTFPLNLKVSSYKVLSSGTFSERVLSQVDDTSRNSLRVVASTAGLQVPRVYTAPDGEQRSIHSTLPTLVMDGKTFTLRRLDPGISFTVYTP